MPTALIGPRVALRPVAPADHAELRALHAAPEVARWWHAVPDAFPDAWEVEHGWTIWLGRERIGYCQAEEELEPHYRSAAADIFVGPQHVGRGLGTEALAVLCAHIFDDRGHHRMTIDPDVGNARAIASYAKVGFRPVGVLREATRFDDGSLGDALLMDLLAAELVRPG